MTKRILQTLSICLILLGNNSIKAILVTASFDKKMAAQQLQNARIIVTSLIQEYSEAKYVDLKNDISSLMQMLNPRERRIANLQKKITDVQKETNDYVAKKNCSNVPLISVVIPVYDRVDVIRVSLDSILTYNWPIPFEVIVVDDCSTDTTYKILLQYESKYQNLFVYKHEQNKGAPATRNTAILHARGAYIFNLDSDDIALPEAVLKMFDCLKQSELEHAFFRHYNFFHDFDCKNIVKKADVSGANNIYSIWDVVACQYDMSLPASIGCRLFTKKSWERVGGFIEDKGHDTWTFSYMQCAAGMSAQLVDECGYLHRTWSNNKCFTYQSVRHNWDASPMIAIREYDEILSSDMYTLLPNLLKKNGALLLEFIPQCKLKFLPFNTVEAIHAMNNYLWYEKFDDALMYFDQAVSYGAQHLYVYLSGLKAAVYAKKIERVESLLEQISSVILV